MTPRSSGPTRVPDLILERYRLGEMTPDETAAFERRVHGDDELRQRLQALEASDEEIRRRYPPAVLAAHVRQRLEACVPDTRRTAGAGLPSVRVGRRSPRWRASWCSPFWSDRRAGPP